MARGFRGAVVRVKPEEVGVRLQELGLTEKVLIDGLEAGLAAKALCTSNHPPNFGGTSFWAEAVRWLRENLIPKGWRRDNSFNFPTIVRHDGKIAIAVAAGDEGTGLPKGNPSTRYERGPVMVGKVEVNQHLPFEHLPAGYGEPDPDTPEATWLLLHFRAGDELRSELSFPLTINKAGFVETWAERILLRVIPIDPARMPVLQDDPVEPTIDIRRKA